MKSRPLLKSKRCAPASKNNWPKFPRTRLGVLSLKKLTITRKQQHCVARTTNVNDSQSWQRYATRRRQKPISAASSCYHFSLRSNHYDRPRWNKTSGSETPKCALRHSAQRIKKRNQKRGTQS